MEAAPQPVLVRRTTQEPKRMRTVTSPVKEQGFHMMFELIALHCANYLGQITLSVQCCLNLELRSATGPRQQEKWFTSGSGSHYCFRFWGS